MATWKTTATGVAPPREIVMEVVRKWSPLGVDRFYQLLLDNYYDCAAFFRVVPGKENRSMIGCYEFEPVVQIT